MTFPRFHSPYCPKCGAVLIPRLDVNAEPNEFVCSKRCTPGFYIDICPHEQTIARGAFQPSGKEIS